MTIFPNGPWAMVIHPANEESAPLFRQIATQLEDAVVDGSLAEESQAPSSNELAAFHRINPATAAKGLNQLVADGVLLSHRRTRAGDAAEAGTRPSTPGILLGMPKVGAPA